MHTTPVYSAVRRLGTGGLLAVLLAACGESPDAPPLSAPDAAVPLSPGAITPPRRLPANAVVRLVPADSAGGAISWSLLADANAPAQGATLDETGTLRTVAPGRYLVLARRGDARASMRVEVTEAGGDAPEAIAVAFGTPLASLTAEQFWIEISPDTIHLAPGDTARLEAYGYSDDGSRWTINTVWKAEQGAIEGGRYVAPASAGDYQVVATRYGDVQTDTAVVVVGDAAGPPQQAVTASAECRNEPSDYRRIQNAPWNMLPARQPAWSEEGFTYFHEQIPTLSLVQDGTGPGSPGSALRMLYPKGFRGGESPSRWGSARLGSNGGNLYVCLWIRFDAHWSTVGISTDKLFYVFQNDAPIWHAMVALGEYDRLTPHALLQYPDSRLNHNVGLTREPRAFLHGGGWHKLEVLWEANTPGQRNGGFRQWVDDQLVAEHRETYWFPSGVTPRYDIVWFDPVFAWSERYVPHDQSFYLDHTVISVK